MSMQHVLLFYSTGGKFRLISNLTELHAVTLARPFLCALGVLHAEVLIHLDHPKFIVDGSAPIAGCLWIMSTYSILA